MTSAVPRRVLGQAVQENIDIVGRHDCGNPRTCLSMTVTACARRACAVRCSISAILVTGFVGLSNTHQAGRNIAQYAFDAGEILDRQQGVSHAVFREQMLHDVPRRPVGLHECEHVIALLAQRQQRRCDGGHARSHQQTLVPALYPRQRQFQLPQSWIRVPGIKEAARGRRAESAGFRFASSNSNFTD